MAGTGPGGCDGRFPYGLLRFRQRGHHCGGEHHGGRHGRGGYGVVRYQVMYNDFIIIGPKDGPVAKTEDIGAVFQQIRDEELTFVSRGDNSGTHNKETGIWENLGITDYESNPNYVSAGAGMGDTINMADEMGGYCLSDRGTWLSRQADYPDMEIVCEGSDDLLNQYGVIAVNPEMYPDVNYAAATTFIEWICSPEVQELIGQFGVEEYGEPLFFPNAEQGGETESASAAEALKLLLGIGESLQGRMLLDLLTMRTEEVEIPVNPRCRCQHPEINRCK